MHHRRRTPVWALAAAFTVAAVLLGTGWSAAQQLGNKEEVEAPFKKNSFKFNKRMYGEEPVTAADKELLDTAAKYYIWRVTWEAVKNDHKALGQIHAELEEMINRAINSSAKNKDFREQMGSALTRSLKPLLELDFLENRVQVTSGAAFLAEVSRLRAAEKPEKDRAQLEDLGDYAAALVKDDKRHIVVRSYAAKALKEFMPVKYFSNLEVGDKAAEKKKERDVTRIDTLTGFIDRPWPTEVSPEAVQFIRRGALESLAQAGFPAVSAEKKLNKTEGLIAPTLIKTLIPKAMTPVPGLPEKIEAAIGLCQMKYYSKPDITEYHPGAELGVYLVGRTLDEYATEFGKDLVNIKVKKYPTTVAWKIQTKRLEIAVKDLVANAKFTPAQKGAEALQKAINDTGLLSNIYNGAQIGQLPQFRNVVAGLKPKTGRVFSTLKAPEFDVP